MSLNIFISKICVRKLDVNSIMLNLKLFTIVFSFVQFPAN